MVSFLTLLQYSQTIAHFKKDVKGVYPAPWMALFSGKNRRFLWEFAQQTPKQKNRHGWRFFCRGLDKYWGKRA
jgi:hypothetical protein